MVFVDDVLFEGIGSCFGIFDALDDFYEVATAAFLAALGDSYVFRYFCHGLLDFSVNSMSTQIGIVLAQLKAFGRVFLVLGRVIAGYTGHTSSFLLGAFEDDLYPIAFIFLCHSV